MVARLVTVLVINRVLVLLMLLYVHVILKMPVHLIVVVRAVIGAYVVVIYVIVVLIAPLILLPLVIEQTVLRFVRSIPIIIVN